MKNKYYTPEIEEFHIGFEYEENVYTRISDTSFDSNWVSKTFTEDTYINFEDDFNYRVKYLDKEDIESLGWELDDEDSELLRLVKGKYTLIRLSLYKNPIRISIKLDTDFIFRGEIKNKSELKRLMKQLKIKI